MRSAGLIGINALIQVISAPGKTSTVCMRLPLVILLTRL